MVTQLLLHSVRSAYTWWQCAVGWSTYVSLAVCTAAVAASPAGWLSAPFSRDETELSVGA